MKASKMLIPTLRDVPNEASISSHILLLRAGMIRKIVAGVYNYLPLGLRTLNKIENIIREEMDESGAQEILCSAIQPKELWEESGRWYKYGPELMRFNDRHNREFCLGPTHEEVFTDLVKNELKSKKNLPINLYQIQTKYRDEDRPRFGLMRGREFIMKDAYSFDINEEGLNASYQNMYETYERIFTRLGINYKIVLADTGSIGGTGSHQFMALSNVGESDIVYCDDCGYAADEEKAESKAEHYREDAAMLEIKKVVTPHQKTIEEVSQFLNISLKDVAKAVMYYDLSHKQVVAVFVRGDRSVNEIKVINELNIAEHEIRFATNEEITAVGGVDGFIGPMNLNCVKLIDEELTITKNLVCGANEKDYHLQNINYKRDFDGVISQFRQADVDDLCPICGGKLKKERGIEVGQIFKLGTKYSKPMKATYQEVSGENVPLVMGCYGIGVTRTMSSIIEQNYDDFGIKWPLNVAPYHAVVVPVNYKNEVMAQEANKIYDELRKAKVEVILDDRDSQPGVKFKDWELIGIPYMIIVGKKAGEGICELKNRSTLEKEELTFGEAINKVLEAVKNI